MKDIALHVGKPVLTNVRAAACSDKLLSTAAHLYACVRVLSNGRTASASSKHEKVLETAPPIRNRHCIPKNQIHRETSMVV